MTTLTGLITDVLDDLNRTDLTAAASSALSEAKEFYETERWWFNERRAKIGTEPDQERLPLPSDYLEVDNIVITDNGHSWPLKQESKYTMDRLFISGSTYKNVPERFTIYDSQIRFYPIPDATYSITMSYQFVMSDLSASTSNVWTNELGQLIRNRASKSVYSGKLHNNERASFHAQQENEWYQKLRRRSDKYLVDGPLKPWL